MLDACDVYSEIELTGELSAKRAGVASRVRGAPWCMKAAPVS
jgi:hypothetical protein